jgi:hypothetical protein
LAKKQKNPKFLGSLFKWFYHAKEKRRNDLFEILINPSKHLEFECLLFHSPFVGKLTGEILGSWLVWGAGLPVLPSRLPIRVNPKMKFSRLKFCILEIIQNDSKILYISQLCSPRSLGWTEPEFTGRNSGSN